MKQETVNSFDGGLNLDLNPITTPNNVLTDCLNGTFLTFNGDEMVLQNDAGNTTIDYNGTPVQLSERFYPLGIREYGGVLYIVSAKKPIDDSVLYNPYTYYYKGVRVHTIVLGKKVYFESKSDVNIGKALPIETNEYWIVIGDIDAFNNYYGEVEFGSYPSPEFGGSSSNYGDCLITNSTVTNFLYKPTPINDYDFKSGRFIKFSSTLSDSSKISRYNLTDRSYIKNFYKLKLWHQLNNGFYDLTNDIWERYLEKYGSGSPDFWFANTDFKYYCPNLYKGKLAVSLEIELPYVFQLVNPPGINYDIVNQLYTFTVHINGQSGSNVWDIRGTTFYYKIIDKGGEVKFEGTLTTTSSNNISTFTFNVPYEYTDYILDYTITPIIYCDNVDITSELPAILEYWKDVTLHGTRIISAAINNVVFKLNNFRCDESNDGTQYVTEVILQNTNGENIDNELNVLPTGGFAFLETNAFPSHFTTTIAHYTIVNGKPVIDTTEPLLSINPDILTSFLNLSLVQQNEACIVSPVVDNNTITIITNLPVPRASVMLMKGLDGYWSEGDRTEVTNTHVFTKTFAVDDKVNCVVYSPNYGYEGGVFKGLPCVYDVSYEHTIVNGVNTVNIGLTSIIYIGKTAYDELSPYILYWSVLGDLSVDTSYSGIVLSINEDSQDAQDVTCSLQVWSKNIIYSPNKLTPNNYSVSQANATFSNTGHVTNVAYNNLPSDPAGYPILPCIANDNYHFLFDWSSVEVSPDDFITVS